MFRSNNRQLPPTDSGGVYQKTGNWSSKPLRALLSETARAGNMYLSYPSMIEDQSVYWAVSVGTNLLLDHEAPVEALRAFPGVPLVKYSSAVRLARETNMKRLPNPYKSIGVSHRAARMEKLASSSRGELARSQIQTCGVYRQSGKALFQCPTLVRPAELCDVCGQGRLPSTVPSGRG